MVISLLGSFFVPNLSPGIALSPGFNSWMTSFGQFFDHGLDLVIKGGNGTVYIPLQVDDPLYDEAAKIHHLSFSLSLAPTRRLQNS